LEVGSLRVQVRGEGGVGVGASIIGVIVIIILRKCDPLGSSELLLQVISDGLLLLPSEGGGALTRPCLIQGLACGSHSSDESLLLLVCGSDGSLSHSRGVILLPLGSGDGGRGGLFATDGGEVGVAARHN
jgi:hypothetical protein